MHTKFEKAVEAARKVAPRIRRQDVETILRAALDVLCDPSEHQMKAVGCGTDEKVHSYRAVWAEGYTRMIEAILTEPHQH